ncbi:hypothetical protein [Confluentibacter lentus]|uniref:hypothetical protein n=1 Tax=Confluentibacter lentus TaxID=1699412 RepID=UPI000C28D7AC|nr:hypothetical protein [Confluentibacter lentus]
MSDNVVRKEGIGSYFHFEKHERFKNVTVPLDLDYNLFYTGREALLYILNEINNTNTLSKIWFPNYYCQHTLGWIKKFYPHIHIYNINPFEFTSDAIDVKKFATKNDVVLINNYWGLSSMTSNADANGPIIIEDHSHGWLSDACLHSTADYCFVSLRKSLPIPLGGMYWKPRAIGFRNTLNFKTDTHFYKIWDTMLDAMSLKSDFIAGDTSVTSADYLPLFYEVEEALNIHTDFVHLKDEHRHFIESYLRFDTRKIKETHLNYLYNKLRDTAYFKIVKRPGFTAFGLHLLFKNAMDFNALRQFLVANHVYPSSLWPDNHLDLEWRYFLNIHIDYRYTLTDMDYIIYLIETWLKHEMI